MATTPYAQRQLAYLNRVQRMGYCVQCKSFRGSDGTAWYCRTCADAINRRKRLGRSPFRTDSDFDLFLRAQQERVQQYTERTFTYYALGYSRYYTRERLMREGDLEVRR